MNLFYFISLPWFVNSFFFQYKRFKNKNVSMAARGIITLFRAINPKLLHRKDRGRYTINMLAVFLLW